jgi:phytanoyl-CoA hydroxylase
MNGVRLDDIELATFNRDGFVVRRGIASTDLCDELVAVAREHLAAQLAPIEYEVDLRYPGSPASLDAKGAETSRRLLRAYSRHEIFRRWATSGEVVSILRELFSYDALALSQCHHNCIMTKQPGYSSVTLWHQDNRYWSFDQQNLISVWLALGNESRENGCLRVIPGTHLMEIDTGRFDAALFLRPDLPENKALIVRSEVVTLNKGDVLFFHSRLFHAAGRNLTNDTKLSLVFTYHESANHPIRGTRSAEFPSITV